MSFFESKTVRMNVVLLAAVMVALMTSTTVSFSQQIGAAGAGDPVDSRQLPRNLKGADTIEEWRAGGSYLPASDKSAYSATWIVHALPLVGTSCETFDESLLDHLDVRICQPGAAGACDLVDEFTADDGEIGMYGDDDIGDCPNYRFEWQAPNALLGVPLEVRFSVAGLHVVTFGYVPVSGFAQPFKFGINDHPRIRARILRLQGFDALQLADVLIGEFGLGSLEMVRILGGAGYEATEIGEPLLSRYGESPEDAAWLLKISGFRAGDTGQLLRDTYGEDVFDTGEILREIGFSCIEIGKTVRELFEVDSQTSLQALAAIDCAPDDNCFFGDDEYIPDEVVATSIVESLLGVVMLELPGYDDPDGTRLIHARFDRTLLPALGITIAEADGESTNLPDHFMAGGGPGQIQLERDYYSLQWRPEESSRNKLHEIRFNVAGLEVASYEFFVGSRNVVLIQFRIDAHPVIRAHMLVAAGLPAAEIVAGLIAEFGLDASDVTKLLYEYGFSPGELAGALRDGLAAGPETVAATLKEAGVSSIFALEALDAAFVMSVVQRASTLRVAGYDALEVWRALEVVLDLDDTAIEELLGDAGFTEEEVLLALAPRLLAKYACLIDDRGPKIYLHPLEPYMPSSIDWYMGVSPLVWGYGDEECAGCRLPAGTVTRDTLVETVEQIRSNGDPEYDFWFDLPEPTEDPIARPGDLASAQTYVHPVRLRDLGVTDLQFWVYYPYNGPGTMRPSSDLFGLGNVCSENPNYGNVAPLGEHESDWEVIVLRFDDATNELLEVYLSAHGDYMRYPAGQLEFEDDHVVAYSGLNGHAMFPHQGANPHQEKYVDFKVGDVELNTYNWAAKGQFLPAWQRYEFMALDGVFLDAPWLEFDGLWGATVPFNLTDNQKVGIIKAAADDCMLAIRFVHIPIASLASCSAGCAVGCAPAALFFGVGYGACFATCTPVCTAALITAANIAINPLLDAYGPDILDQAFSDQEGTGKPTPASRGEEWKHFRVPNEKPRILRIADFGDPAADVRQIVVSIPDQVCERKGPHWGLGAALCVDTPVIGAVELGIDGEYFDITNSAERVGSEWEFTYSWDTTTASGGSHMMSPRYANTEGLFFEYTKGFGTSTAGPVVGLQLSLDQVTIPEGGTVMLGGIVTDGTAPYEVEIDWADGSTETFPSATDDFMATHSYANDGVFPIGVVVSDDNTGMTTATARLIVGNLPPEVGDIQLTPSADSLIPVGAFVDTSASFTDVGIADSHSAEWDWGDGVTEVQVGIGSPAAASHAYNTAGVRTISLAVTDDSLGLGRSSTRSLVISDGGQTAGTGTVLAPVAELETGEATFTLDLSTNASNEPVVAFDFMIGSLVFNGVQQPLVTYSGNMVEVDGMVSIDGSPLAPNGMPYQIYLAATDGPDTLYLRIWYLDQGVETIAYQTEVGQALVTGNITLNEADGSTGNGSILAPVVDDPTLGATLASEFGFVVVPSSSGPPVVEFDYRVGGLELSGVMNPAVTTTTSRVEIAGGVLVNGDALAPNGNPYIVRVIANDSPDTFQVIVSYLDGSGTEQVYFETDADQALLTGEVTVAPPPPLESSPRNHQLREGALPDRTAPGIRPQRLRR